ncbi:MAG TPA: heavy metal sensor histidine kinase [Phycisphaerae bacterium]|nr:heavy metal sensor histidine kinase [Phycisphaerae bacterium]
MSSGNRDNRSAGLTIGMRLTLWGTAVTTAVCLILCIGLYLGLSYSLYAEVDGFLAGEVQEFRTTLNEYKGDLKEVERDIRRELGSRPRADLNFRLLDKDGNLLVTGDPRDRLDQHWAFEIPARSDIRPIFETIPIKGTEQSARVCMRWLKLPDGTPCVIQATYLLDRVGRSLSLYRRWSATGLIAAALLALWGGRWLARRSLRDVGRMTHAARRIGSGSLAERIARTGTGDELDHLAATLNEMLDRIENQFRQIQQFTADAAHELRTPLAALRSSAEVALSRPRSADELRKVVEDSIEYYGQLARLTDDLLLLARADAGQMQLHRERMRLDQAVCDVVDLFSATAHEKGIQLQVDRAEATWVNADAGRIRQLVGNLLDNSIKYIGQGSRIDVAVWGDNGRCLLTVKDDGMGVPAEDLPRVFDRFYRVDKARSSKNEAARTSGAGLGLAICRSITRVHSGTIELASGAEGGTRVTVSLPRAEDQGQSEL